MPQFDRWDIYVAIVAVVFTLFAVITIRAAFTGKFPSVQTLQQLATLVNTKGGIVILLFSMWWFTLIATVCFGVWVIVKGIDPQHAVVVTILGMLISQAFGNVNGALFKTMTGEDPKPISPAPTRTFLAHTEPVQAEEVVMEAHEAKPPDAPPEVAA